MSKIYLFFAEKIVTVEIKGLEVYLQYHREFKKSNQRLIIPFRHIAKADAPVLSAVFGQILPGKQKKTAAHYWIHFLFGDMVLDWAGAAARWIFPRIGALPVSNQKVVKFQFDRIKDIILHGDKPLCFAPEGQVNYYNHKPGDLTGGLNHFIRWSLHAEKKIAVLPVRIYYIYKRENPVFSKLSDEMKSLGFIGEESSVPEKNLDFYVLSLLRFLCNYLSGSSQSDLIFDDNEELLPVIYELLIESGETRYPIRSGRRVLDKVLIFRNSVFNDLRLSGYTVPEMMKMIGRSWEYPQRFTELMRLYQHQQLLDVLTNFDPNYHHGDKNRHIEQALFLLDIINRIKGGDINSRYFPGGTKAIVHFYNPQVFKPGDNPDLWRQSFLSHP